MAHRDEMVMVARVAAVIYPGIWDDDFGPHLTDAAIASLRGRAIKTARAAIEAMRTPTEAMARGAMAAHSQYLVGGSRPLEDVLTSEAFEGAMATFHRSYTAAIDAALSHDEVKG